MSTSPEFRSFVLEQLGRVVPVTSRSMFGGVGIYSGGLFFALMDGDSLYLKVDDGNRPAFERIGSRPFQPYDDERTMQYYELPTDILEDVDELREWVEGAVAVAGRARARRKR
ncbi:MAG TPA: TfoX/Sxy family protein [Longimicrobiales bacterium]|nr:TfoX/Sxy family protein [Longimicrobiales bacterium]